MLTPRKIQTAAVRNDYLRLSTRRRPTCQQSISRQPGVSGKSKILGTDFIYIFIAAAAVVLRKPVEIEKLMFHSGFSTFEFPPDCAHICAESRAYNLKKKFSAVFFFSFYPNYIFRFTVFQIDIIDEWTDPEFTEVIIYFFPVFYCRRLRAPAQNNMYTTYIYTFNCTHYI